MYISTFTPKMAITFLRAVSIWQFT